MVTEVSGRLFQASEKIEIENSTNNKSIYDNQRIHNNRKVQSDSGSYVTMLQQFINFNNISMDTISARLGKSISSITKLDIGSCHNLLIELRTCAKLEKLIKETFQAEIKEILSVDDVYKLPIDVCNECIKTIEHSKKQQSDNENLKLNLKKAYFCRLLGINKHDIKENELEHFINGTEYAIKDSTNNKGQIDIKKAQKLAFDYKTALDYQWDSIEDFKKYQAMNSDGLQERVKNILNKKKKVFSKFTEEKKLKEASKEYFKGLESALAAKVKEKIKNGSLNQKEAEEWFNKIYEQNLGKLIVNTPAKHRDMLIEIAANAKADLRPKVIETVLKKISQESPQTAAKTADELNENEQIYDGSSPEEAGKTQQVISSYQSEEGVKKTIETNNENLISFSKENEAKLKDIELKIKNGTKLSDKEAKLWKEYQTLLHKNNGGQFGFIENENVSQNTNKQDEITVLQSKLQINAEQAYRDQQAVTQQTIHKLNLTNEQIERLIDFFNTATNGNFSLLSENRNAKLNPPVDIEKIVNKNTVGIEQKNIDVCDAAKESVKTLSQIIAEQTKAGEGEQVIYVECAQESQVKTIETPSFLNNLGIKNTFDISSLNLDLASDKIIRSLGVAELKQISISFKTLVEKLPKLQQSVQNHVLAQLKTKSEAEETQYINNMDSTIERFETAKEVGIEYETIMTDINLDSATLAIVKEQVEKENEKNDLG